MGAIRTGLAKFAAKPSKAHYKKTGQAALPLLTRNAILMGSIRIKRSNFSRSFSHSFRISSNMATSSKAKKKTVRLASGRKRARQDVVLNAANTSLRSKFRTVVKNVQKALDKAATGGDKAVPAELFKNAQSVIDSIADKGIFHKNKAARHKSRLSAKIKALSATAAA